MSTAPSNEVVTDALARAKPPFLRRVRIAGYKSIAFCDVTLEPLTILVGRNASGKSNFLDALAFLRDIVKFGVSEAVNRHGGTEAIRCKTQEDRAVILELECQYPIAGDADLWLATYRIDVELPATRPAKIRREELRISQGEWWVGYTNEAGRVTCGAAADQPQQRTWKVKERPFLDSYHDTPVPEFVECLEAITTYNFNPEAIRLPRKPTPGGFLERAGGNLASVIESVREIDESTVQRVGAYLSAVVREVERFEVARYGEYETVRFHLDGASPSRSREFDASSMSDGTLRVLACLMAAYQIHLPSGPSLVGIEEPETSLHPAAIRALVDALDEATLRTQLLLTTHSAEMLDNPTIRPENVRVVQMIDGQTMIGPVDEASVEIVREKLDTLGGLERQNQLELDLDDQERQRRLSRTAPGPRG